MNDQDNFFDSEIGGDEEAGDSAIIMEQENDLSLIVRTVILSKNDMLALLSLKTSAQAGLIVRIDPRQSQPAAQTYEDPAAAKMWFRRSLATSQKNGWNVVYDGEPLFG